MRVTLEPRKPVAPVRRIFIAPAVARQL